MSSSKPLIVVYLEAGEKRVIAGAMDWPGWCRVGRDEASALQALFDYGPRYGRALRNSRLGFRAPKDVAEFKVVERLKGNAATDYGVPNKPPESDAKGLKAAELTRLKAVLSACWRAFDAAAEEAAGKDLRKGARGGGRDLEGISRHVLGAEASYVGSLGYKFKPDEGAALAEALRQVRAAALDALDKAAAGELPKRGPRGGLRWKPRYFAKRAAWHVLDHAWEIEDRLG